MIVKKLKSVHQLLGSVFTGLFLVGSLVPAVMAETFSIGGMALNTNNRFPLKDGHPIMSIWPLNSSDNDQQFDRQGNSLRHRSTGKCLNAYQAAAGSKVNVYPSLAVTAHPAFAGGGSGQSDSSTSSTITTTPTNSTTSTSSIPTTQYNQQSGLQVNWSGSSSLSPPSCNGGCVFAVTRASPVTYGYGTNLEAMVGVILPIGSNDGGVGELNRLNGEMQKYRTEHEIKLALSEKLADALENQKMERATIIAMNLAPMLGYKDYHLLLRDVSIPKPISSNQLLKISQIYSAVMY
jgi:hypothetical protein